MFDLWTEDLSEEKTDEMIAKAASEIKRRKMEVPAILMFEMHKPLSFVAANAAVVFSPFLVPFLGFDSVNDYSRLFAKRENVERLLLELEKTKDAPDRSEDLC